MTQEELNILFECRNRARDVARKEREINAALPTRRGLYSSPQMTGMPGSRDVHGLDGSARKNEAEHQALERAKVELEGMQEAAMKIICTLEPKLHDFCVAYFINGLEMPGEVAEHIGKDRSTCWRQLRKIREGGDFRRKMQRNATKCDEMRLYATGQGVI